MFAPCSLINSLPLYLFTSLKIGGVEVIKCTDYRWILPEQQKLLPEYQTILSEK